MSQGTEFDFCILNNVSQSRFVLCITLYTVCERAKKLFFVNIFIPINFIKYEDYYKLKDKKIVYKKCISHSVK